MAPKKAVSARKSPAAGGKRKQLTFAASVADEASRAVQTTRHITFADASATTAKKKPVVPAMKPHSGIVMAVRGKKSSAPRAAGKRPRDEDDDELEEDEEAAAAAALVAEEDDAASLVNDSDAGSSEEDGSEAGMDGEDDLSDVAGAESDGSEDGTSRRRGAGGAAAAGDENPFARAKRTGARLEYKALRLRFLPQEFQEPQLFKFLGQFGAEVLNCFCVRSSRTHQSKGIAYVQFDTEDVLPLVVEECNGMALGGRAVRARVVTLRRAMPSKEKVAKRRRLAYAYKTKGAPLKQHNVLGKNPVGLLIKAARTEASNNAYLQSLGIDFTSSLFADQLRSVPPQLVTKPTKLLVDAGVVGQRQTAAAGPKEAATASTPAKAAAAPSPTKATSPTPKKVTSPTPVKATSPTPTKATSATQKKAISPTPVKATSPTPTKATSATPTKKATPLPKPSKAASTPAKAAAKSVTATPSPRSASKKTPTKRGRASA